MNNTSILRIDNPENRRLVDKACAYLYHKLQHDSLQNKLNVEKDAEKRAEYEKKISKNFGSCKYLNTDHANAFRTLCYYEPESVTDEEKAEKVYNYTVLLLLGNSGKAMKSYSIKDTKTVENTTVEYVKTISPLLLADPVLVTAIDKAVKTFSSIFKSGEFETEIDENGCRTFSTEEARKKYAGFYNDCRAIVGYFKSHQSTVFSAIDLGETKQFVAKMDAIIIPKIKASGDWDVREKASVDNIYNEMSRFIRQDATKFEPEQTAPPTDSTGKKRGKKEQTPDQKESK